MRTEIVKFLESVIARYKVQSVLDVGCYDGYTAFRIAKKNIHVTAIDKENSFLKKYNKRNIAFLNLSLQKFYKINFDKRFDLVVCENVLPFMPNLNKRINEIVDLSDIVYFNIWGDCHVWAKGNKYVNRKQFNIILKTISKTHEVIVSEEKKYKTETFATGNKKVDWHEFIVLAKRIS